MNQGRIISGWAQEAKPARKQKAEPDGPAFCTTTTPDKEFCDA
jgi:hypothetical protein